MLSTSQKWPKVYFLFICYFFLAFLQWPASYLIQNVSLPLGVLLNEGVFVAGIPLAITAMWRIPFAQLFPFKKPCVKTLFWLVVMTLSLLVVIDYLTFLSEQVLPLPPAVRAILERLMQISSFEEGLWRWFLICLTPAFCEEIFFRGFFQKSLEHHWGENLGWVLTAVGFTLIHGIPWYWHLYFILGLYLGWLMLVGRNLWFPILAHLLNNSWTFFNHALNHKIPAHDTWHTMDSFVMGVCLMVFAVAAMRFSEACETTL